MDLDSGLAAGYGECVISPPLGLELCGYGFHLERRALSLLDDLKARAVLLRAGRSALLLIVCDLIGFAVAHSDAIRDAIAARLGLRRSDILLACTHTHTGPATLALRGVGEMDDAYVATLACLLERAAVAAAADCRPASLACGLSYVEPIGFNRRKRSFEPIDALLKVAVLQRSTDSIALTSYACHAVTLGRATSISADWPGGVARAFERRGYRALAFQGFCGDIDPTVFLNAWGSGTPQDLDYYGELICQRALKSVYAAAGDEHPRLASAEERVTLPLQVPPTLADIDRARDAFLASGPGSGGERMISDWHAAATARHAQLLAAPCLPDVPVQAMALGGLRLLGLPGEVFCEYGTRLRRQTPALFPVGYAGGCVGYLPTTEAYADAGDYACYQAPRFYQVFPFAPSVEGVVLEAAERGLRKVAG